MNDLIFSENLVKNTLEFYWTVTNCFYIDCGNAINLLKYIVISFHQLRFRMLLSTFDVFFGFNTNSCSSLLM